VKFAGFREPIDTDGPLGRAIEMIIGAITELESNLIVERLGAGMRRVRHEGQRIGRRRLELNREAICNERQSGRSLGQSARAYRISRTTIRRVLGERPLRRSGAEGS
jgi:DNA invertase Pin-like site-specific DNA recombinase